MVERVLALLDKLKPTENKTTLHQALMQAACHGQKFKDSRILIVQAVPEDAACAKSIVNAVFACQKKNIQIDALSTLPTTSLQQACEITGGFFKEFKEARELLPIMMSGSFLASSRH